jgi:hypothetical protein
MSTTTLVLGPQQGSYLESKVTNIFLAHPVYMPSEQKQQKH